jgi:hypothetical protein
LSHRAAAAARGKGGRGGGSGDGGGLGGFFWNDSNYLGFGLIYFAVLVYMDEDTFDVLNDYSFAFDDCLWVVAVTSGVDWYSVQVAVWSMTVDLGGMSE